AELAQTRRALADTQASLQTTIEELESSNEELQSTNEELIASNEELQSTNEELQSVNEELRMVNDEHQAKVEELAMLNHTLDAVLNGVEVGIVLLDDQIRLSRFNPAATRFLNVRTVDLGRPLAHITHTLDFSDMVETIAEVLRTGTIHERYVEADEHDILVRIRPTLRGDATDALLTFTEVTSLLQAQRDATQFRSALALTGLQAAIVRPDGHLLACNEAFAEALERDIEYINRVNLFDIVGESSLDHLRRGLKTASKGHRWQGIVRVRLTDGRATYLLVELASDAEAGTAPASCLWTARPLSGVLLADEAFTNEGDGAGYWLWDPEKDETYTNGKLAEIWGRPGTGSPTLEWATNLLAARPAKELREEIDSALEHGSGRITVQVNHETETRTLVVRLERCHVDGHTYLMGETRLQEVRPH
ncbi:MAG: PAS domain-containing protein, partial [Myxococcota bacterium]